MSQIPRATIQFPSPEEAGYDGLVAVGGELNIGNLYAAYSQGIFPWPQEGFPMLWFSPDPRGILRFSKLHISRSLSREQKRAGFNFTFDKAFEQVVEFCSIQKRKDQNGTWILPEMKQAYLELHRMGYAHSVECWQSGSLVGGLYGVFVEGVFSGESMFFRETGASKLSLVYLIEHLASRGLEWMDTQMVTPVLKQMGAEEVSRSDYFKLLGEARKRLKNVDFYD